MGDQYDAFLDSEEIDSFLDAPDATLTPTVSQPVKPLSTMEQLERQTLMGRYKAGTLLYPEEETAIRQTLQGAASGPISGIAQMFADYLGRKDISEKIAQTKREGNVAGAFLQPESWIGGGKLLQMGKNTLQKAGIFSTYGGGYAAASPTSEAGNQMEQRLDQAALPTAVSAAIPVVGAAVSKMTPGMIDLVNSIKATILKSGRLAVGQKMVLDQMVPAERDAVLTILSKEGIDVSQLGSQLTTGQTLAANRVATGTAAPEGARLMSLQDRLAKTRGGEAINKTYEAQAANQQGILGSLTGARGQIAQPLEGLTAADVGLLKAKAARTATAKQTYPSGMVSGDDVLEGVLSRPAVGKALGTDITSAENAQRLVSIPGMPAKVKYENVFTDWQQTPYKEEFAKVFPKYSIESLQNQYRLLEKEYTRLMKTGASTDEVLAGEIKQAQKALGSWLAEKSPEWAQANRIFAMQSQPVNQMKVGQELEKRLAASPESFLGATTGLPAQEQLIRSVTGRPNQRLTDIYKLGDMSKIVGLQNEAQIAQEVDKLRKLATADLSDKAPTLLPNLLNVWVAVANRFAKEMAKATVDDVTRESARILANPQELRKLLQSDAARRAASKVQPTWSKPLGQMTAPVAGMLTGATQ